MTPACIAIALGAAVVTIPVEHFTLSWTHSIEKIRWEEDYELRSKGLLAVAARVRGNGAGMEVPEGAVLRDGVWHYVPAPVVLPVLRLARSRFVADYEICWDGRCQTFGQLVPRAASSTPAEIRACP